MNNNLPILDVWCVSGQFRNVISENGNESGGKLFLKIQKSQRFNNLFCNSSVIYFIAVLSHHEDLNVSE